MKTKGKARIYSALGGLVLVLAPAVVFSIINPAILNLSVNLPALNTQSGSSSSSSSSSASGATTPVQTIASSTTFTNQGGSLQSNVYLCSGTDCTQQVKQCNTIAGGTISTSPAISCYNPATQQQDTSVTPPACKSGEEVVVVCTILEGPQ